MNTFESAEGISLTQIIGGCNVFALRVRGDFALDEHILDGDYVLVEKTSTIHEGDVVIALVNGSKTTLMRYYAEVSAGLAIYGRVVGVLRKYK